MPDTLLTDALERRGLRPILVDDLGRDALVFTRYGLALPTVPLSAPDCLTSHAFDRAREASQLLTEREAARCPSVCTLRCSSCRHCWPPD